MFNTLDELEAASLKWSQDRGITINGKVTTQALKLVSEVGELADNVAKDNMEAVKDDIGDCLVVLTNLAKLSSTNLVECWNIAYEDIKDRKGFLNENGTFIKDTDPSYNKLRPKDLLIDKLVILQEVSLFPTYTITITFSDGSKDYLELLPNEPTFSLYDTKIAPVFVGKTKEQLIAYLKTIGDISEGTLND